MSAYRNYPEGHEPSAGPFEVFIQANPAQFIVQASPVFVVLNDPRIAGAYCIAPSEARELAAALIECADHIDRANMTAEDIARETRNRT